MGGAGGERGKYDRSGYVTAHSRAAPPPLQTALTSGGCTAPASPCSWVRQLSVGSQNPWRQRAPAARRGGWGRRAGRGRRGGLRQARAGGRAAVGGCGQQRRGVRQRPRGGGLSEISCLLSPADRDASTPAAACGRRTPVVMVSTVLEPGCVGAHWSVPLERANAEQPPAVGSWRWQLRTGAAATESL